MCLKAWMIYMSLPRPPATSTPTDTQLSTAYGRIKDIRHLLRAVWRSVIRIRCHAALSKYRSTLLLTNGSGLAFTVSTVYIVRGLCTKVEHYFTGHATVGN